MSDQAMKFARDLVCEEFLHCLLNGWTVEFIPMNDGTDLRIHMSKMGKHSYQIIPIAINPQFYIKIWEVMNSLRYDIMEEFPYVGT